MGDLREMYRHGYDDKLAGRYPQPNWRAGCQVLQQLPGTAIDVAAGADRQGRLARAYRIGWSDAACGLPRESTKVDGIGQERIASKQGRA